MSGITWIDPDGAGGPLIPMPAALSHDLAAQAAFFAAYEPDPAPAAPTIPATPAEEETP